MAPLLTEAGLASDFDFDGNLTPASHAGYDLLLDLTDVALSQDGSVPTRAHRLAAGHQHRLPGARRRGPDAAQPGQRRGGL